MHVTATHTKVLIILQLIADFLCLHPWPGKAALASPQQPQSSQHRRLRQDEDIQSWVCSWGDSCTISDQPVDALSNTCAQLEVADNVNSYCICATSFDQASSRCADFCDSIETEVLPGFLLLAALENASDNYCTPCTTQEEVNACLDEGLGTLCGGASC